MTFEEVELKSGRKILVDKEKIDQLANFPDAIIETCIEKGCNLDDILNIGSNLMYNACRMMIDKGIPKDKVIPHMDYIYSCAKDLLEEYENPN